MKAVSARGRTRKFRNVRRQWPPLTQDELRWWYREHTPAEIAIVYGVAIVTLRAYWRRNGLNPPKRNWRQSFFERVEKGPGCWLWTGSCNEAGYGFAKADGVQTKAHRLAWEIENKSTIPSGMIVMHACDNPRCVNPRHLSVGTHSDNALDAFSKDRREARRGAKNGKAIITPEQVLVARGLVAGGVSVRAVAHQLDVPYSGIWKAVRGRSWAWL